MCLYADNAVTLKPGEEPKLSLERNQHVAPVPEPAKPVSGSSSGVSSVSRLLEEARTEGRWRRYKKGEIAVSPVITETDLKTIATHPDPTARIINGSANEILAYDVTAENNNNDLLFHSGKLDPLRTDVDKTIREVETSGRDMLDNFDSMVRKQHNTQEEEVKPMSAAQSIREKYRKYLPDGHIEPDKQTTERSWGAKHGESTQPNAQQSRYERFREKFSARKDSEENDTETGSRFSRNSSATMPTRLRRGYDARKQSIEDAISEQQAHVPRSSKYARPSRLTGEPIMPSSISRTAHESELLDQNVQNHIKHSTEPSYSRWLPEEDRTRHTNRLQDIIGRYSSRAETDTPLFESESTAPVSDYAPLTNGPLSDFTSSASSQPFSSRFLSQSNDQTTSPRSTKSDKEDSHSES